MLGIEYILFTTGISNKEIAILLDLSPSAISHFISGRRKMKWRQKLLLSEYTGVPPEYFSKEISRKDKVEIELVLGAESESELAKVTHEVISLREENKDLTSRLERSETIRRDMVSEIITFLQEME